MITGYAIIINPIQNKAVWSGVPLSFSISMAGNSEESSTFEFQNFPGEINQILILHLGDAGNIKPDDRGLTYGKPSYDNIGNAFYYGYITELNPTSNSSVTSVTTLDMKTWFDFDYAKEKYTASTSPFTYIESIYNTYMAKCSPVYLQSNTTKFSKSGFKFPDVDKNGIETENFLEYLNECFEYWGITFITTWDYAQWSSRTKHTDSKYNNYPQAFISCEFIEGVDFGTLDINDSKYIQNGEATVDPIMDGNANAICIIYVNLDKNGKYKSNKKYWRYITENRTITSDVSDANIAQPFKPTVYLYCPASQTNNEDEEEEDTDKETTTYHSLKQDEYGEWTHEWEDIKITTRVDSSGHESKTTTTTTISNVYIPTTANINEKINYQALISNTNDVEMISSSKSVTTEKTSETVTKDTTTTTVTTTVDSSTTSATSYIYQDRESVTDSSTGKTTGYKYNSCRTAADSSGYFSPRVNETKTQEDSTTTVTTQTYDTESQSMLTSKIVTTKVSKNDSSGVERNSTSSSVTFDSYSSIDETTTTETTVYSTVTESGVKKYKTVVTTTESGKQKDKNETQTHTTSNSSTKTTLSDDEDNWYQNEFDADEIAEDNLEKPEYNHEVTFKISKWHPRIDKIMQLGNTGFLLLNGERYNSMITKYELSSDSDFVSITCGNVKHDIATLLYGDDDDDSTSGGYSYGGSSSGSGSGASYTLVNEAEIDAIINKYIKGKV